MKIYVLDTDIAGFVQNENLAVISHIKALSEDDSVVTTIVTFGEDFGGWLPACRRATDGASRAQAYIRLQNGLDFYREMLCLPFDDVAAGIFDDLRKQIRVGTDDLAIAAITLSVNGVLVTRNMVDFRKIPGLAIEDWAT